MRLLLRVADAVRAVVAGRAAAVRADLGHRLGRGGLGHRAVGRAGAACSSARGVDLIDVSSGGAVRHQQIPVGAGLPGAVRRAHPREAGILTGAVGLITEPAQADEIVASGQADLVFLARELLRDPYFPRRAAKALGAELTRRISTCAPGSRLSWARRRGRVRSARARSGRPWLPHRQPLRSA